MHTPLPWSQLAALSKANANAFTTYLMLLSTPAALSGRRWQQRARPGCTAASLPCWRACCPPMRCTTAHTSCCGACCRARPAARRWALQRRCGALCLARLKTDVQGISALPTCPAQQHLLRNMVDVCAMPAQLRVAPVVSCSGPAADGGWCCVYARRHHQGARAGAHAEAAPTGCCSDQRVISQS